MIVSIVIDPRHVFAWHLRLAARLRARGHEVRLAEGAASPPWPSSVQLILDLEGLVYRRSRQSLSGRVPRPQSPPATEGAPDIVLDLTARPLRDDDPAVRVLFEGVPEASAAVAALLDGTPPHLDIVAGVALLASGAPATENPASLGAGLDAMAARLIDLLAQVVARASRAGHDAMVAEATRAHAMMQRDRAGGVATARFALQTLGAKAKARLLTRVTRPEQWRIGYRLLDGPGLWETHTVPGDYTWVNDDGGRYFADPFPIVHEGRTWMFCEEYPYATRKGILSVFEVLADGTATAPVPILETGSHLSYPYVFQQDGVWWMIPESSAAGEIALYRAIDFPWRWTRERVLVDGVDASDTTPVTMDGQVWLFATLTGEAGGSTWDALSLFHASTLSGPFVPHRLNPVLVDAAAARPAGRMRHLNGALMRVAQDCRGGYGVGLTVARVDRLDAEDYRQTVTGVLRAPPAWQAVGFHTLNVDGRCEAVDCLHAPLAT